MFHTGDLQSGISFAVQQAKSVACFVSDDSDESRVWQDEWLHDERVAQLLASKSVNLRLAAGSVEAGFLAAFCPIHKTPALVVVHNGQLRLSLFAGVEKEDFVARLAAVLESEEAEKDDQGMSAESQSRESSVTPPAPSAASTQTTSSPYTESAPSAAESNTTLSALLPDRAARLEADRRRAAEAEAAARREKAAGKRRAVEEEVAKAASSSSQISYAAQEKLRKQAQKSELQRILDRVEADKRERREQAEMRRRLREAESSASPQAEIAEEPRTRTGTATMTMTTSSSRGPASRGGTVCLRIRLLDGTQLRDYFAPTATLATDVRPRVDAAISPSSPSSPPPYTFKLLLAPQHVNRHLSAADEALPLHDVGDVAPSATLVLVPVRNAASAASSAYTAVGGGYIGSVYVALLAAYNLLASFVGTFFAPFARGGATDRAASDADVHAGPDSSAAASASGRDASNGSATGSATARRTGAGSDNTGHRDSKSNSPAAAAASSSWSAKHRHASSNPAQPSGASHESGGSGATFNGQNDVRGGGALGASVSGGSPLGSGHAAPGASAGGASRIRTLRDRTDGADEERRTQYYNGNSLGFEGDDENRSDRRGGGDGGSGGE